MSAVAVEIKINAIEMERWGKDYLLTSNVSSMDQFEFYAQEVQSKAVELTDYTDDQAVLNASTQIQGLAEEYMDAFGSVFDTMGFIETDGETEDLKAELNEYQSDLTRIYSEMVPIFGQFEEIANTALVTATTSFDETRSSAEMLLIIMCSVMVVLVGTVAFLLLQSISIPLASVEMLLVSSRRVITHKKFAAKHVKTNLVNFQMQLEIFVKRHLKVSV
jgi:hypothetical protein